MLNFKVYAKRELGQGWEVISRHRSYRAALRSATAAVNSRGFALSMVREVF